MTHFHKNCIILHHCEVRDWWSVNDMVGNICWCFSFRWNKRSLSPQAVPAWPGRLHLPPYSIQWLPRSSGGGCFRWQKHQHMSPVRPTASSRDPLKAVKHLHHDQALEVIICTDLLLVPLNPSVMNCDFRNFLKPYDIYWRRGLFIYSLVVCVLVLSVQISGLHCVYKDCWNQNFKALVNNQCGI